nr:NIPSNAP family protein [Bradyrhizobium liaoningense]
MRVEQHFTSGGKPAVIYEIRTYEAAEGKAAAMRDRFISVVASKFFPRHGIELVGAFVAPAEDGRFTYMTRFPSEEARKKAWDAFAADPEWAKVKEETEKNGPLLKNQFISVLSPTMAGLVLQ